MNDANKKVIMELMESLGNLQDSNILLAQGLKKLSERMKVFVGQTIRQTESLKGRIEALEIRLNEYERTDTKTKS